MLPLYKIIGIVGLILITLGVLNRNRKVEDLLYVAGGLCLAVYSMTIGDLIFILLQVIFICAATYDFLKLEFSNEKPVKKKRR